ncbi:hypothetical protein MOBT1_000168 [Malassezia obtusa]|uniref:Asl1-like glycosyl hydrolase catalytic domain-containing protein n=1 Tax=Malassezia obtusa TaxID=76774 RepID=A0AAF0IQK4_9BASI|nr:hypothetical protein MOBT1_000168 [Malassezia obtusa]
MKFLSTVTVAATAIAVFCAESVSAKPQFGIPWGADDRWAKKIPSGVISWYHHWEKGYVAQMPKHTEYVPTFWGPQKYAQWELRKGEIAKHNSSHILAFNEPDIPTQANLDPEAAVELWMKELQPYAEQGKNVSSPQMVWNLNWIQQFMDKCKARGCKVGFMALHWYGSYKDLDLLKQWIGQIYSRYHLPIWVTEFGVTADSNPTQQQVSQFARDAIQWMSTLPYVERVAWNGGYDIANPPDKFATPFNALFANGGQFRQLANVYLPTLSTKIAAQKNQVNHAHGQGHGHGHKRHQHMVKRVPAFHATQKRSEESELQN